MANINLYLGRILNALYRECQHIGERGEGKGRGEVGDRMGRVEGCHGGNGRKRITRSTISSKYGSESTTRIILEHDDTLAISHGTVTESFSRGRIYNSLDLLGHGVQSISSSPIRPFSHNQ